MGRDLKEAAQMRRELDEYLPGWREMKHENGKPKYAQDGTMLTDRGVRSIFDDLTC